MIKETNEFINLSKIAYIYNSGQMNIVGFSRFTIKAGTTRSYPTSRCAIIIPVSGTGIFEFDEQTYHIKKGIILHGCPHELLTIRASAQHDFEYINLYYNADCDALFSVDVEHPDKLISILNCILKLSSHPSVKNEYLIDSYTDKFFELLFSKILPVDIRSETDLIKNTIDYIHLHYQHPVTLQELADYAGETPSRISYLFQKHLSIRPINYLIDYRIKKAIELLNDTSLTIEEVAKEIGYHDALYFSRIFKKRMGFPPSTCKHLN